MPGPRRARGCRRSCACLRLGCGLLMVLLADDLSGGGPGQGRHESDLFRTLVTGELLSTVGIDVGLGEVRGAYDHGRGHAQTPLVVRRAVDGALHDLRQLDADVLTPYSEPVHATPLVTLPATAT